MPLSDIYEIYAGTSVDPVYPPNGSIPDWTPTTFAAGTDLAPGSVLHSRGTIPLGATTGTQVGGVQYVMPFVGEAQVLILKVITPASGGSTAITVNYVTDSVAALNSTLATLATLSIPYATAADTYFVLELTPTLNFQIYSGLQIVVPSGESIGIAAWLAPKKALDLIQNYISGWVVLS